MSNTLVHAEFIEFEDGMFIATSSITQFAKVNNDEKGRWLLIFDSGLSAGYRSVMVDFESPDFFKIQAALRLRR